MALSLRHDTPTDSPTRPDHRHRPRPAPHRLGRSRPRATGSSSSAAARSSRRKSICRWPAALLAIHEGLATVLGDFRPVEAAVEQTFVNKDGVAHAETRPGPRRRHAGARDVRHIGCGICAQSSEEDRGRRRPRRQKPDRCDAQNIVAEGRTEIRGRRRRAGDRDHARPSPPGRGAAGSRWRSL